MILDFPYVDNVIHEVLRMHPPVPRFAIRQLSNCISKFNKKKMILNSGLRENATRMSLIIILKSRRAQLSLCQPLLCISTRTTILNRKSSILIGKIQSIIEYTLDKKLFFFHIQLINCYLDGALKTRPT